MKEKTETPKKKRHIGLKILISFLIIFLVLPLTFIFGFLITWQPGADLSNIPQINSLNEVINDELYNSLNSEYTTDANNPRVELKLGQNELNAILGLVRKNYFPATVQQYIPQLYCEISGKDYTFGIDAKYSILQTSVKVKTEIIENDDKITFKLKSVQLGRVPLLNFIQDELLKLGTQYISDAQLNNFFKSHGINVKFDLEHGEISYAREDFVNDLVKLISNPAKNEGGTAIDLMSILVELVKIEQLFDSVTDDGLGAKIYLNSDEKIGEHGCSLMKYPDNISPTPTRENRLNFENVRDYTINVMNDPRNGNLDATTAIPDLFNFFVYGYDENASYDQTCQSVTSWQSVSEVIGGNYKNYLGEAYRSSAKTQKEDLTENMQKKIDGKIKEGSLITLFQDNFEEIAGGGEANETINDFLTITGDDLRILCSQFDGIGFNKPIFKKTTRGREENYDANYIGLKDLDFTFVDGDKTNSKDIMNAYVTMDINENDNVHIILNTVLNDTTDATKISFALANTYLGQISTKEDLPELDKAIVDLIKSKVQASDTLFTLDEDGNIYVDFGVYLSQDSRSLFSEEGKTITLTNNTQSINVNIKAIVRPNIVHNVSTDKDELSFSVNLTAKKGGVITLNNSSNTYADIH